MTRRNYWEAVIADEEYLTNWNYTQYINMYIVHCTQYKYPCVLDRPQIRPTLYADVVQDSGV